MEVIVNNYELNSRINALHNKDKALLRLIFEENIPKVTLLWLYRVRYRTLQTRLINLFRELRSK